MLVLAPLGLVTVVLLLGRREKGGDILGWSLFESLVQPRLTQNCPWQVNLVIPEVMLAASVICFRERLR